MGLGGNSKMSGDRNGSGGSASDVSIPRVLLRAMLNGNDSLNFCHLNVSSVKSKIDELRSTR